MLTPEQLIKDPSKEIAELVTRYERDIDRQLRDAFTGGSVSIHRPLLRCVSKHLYTAWERALDLYRGAWVITAREDRNDTYWEFSPAPRTSKRGGPTVDEDPLNGRD